MPFIKLQHYFLDDMERIRMENVIVDWIPGANRWTLEMDDRDILEVYHKCLKEQAMI
ncbi:hypothetical protein [Ectobacillus panaciterrae]|uniref:hypothetical protein n=1 Tax=Ectobacillus panaciterrae TaxID=363872 RepID=UPI000402E253|nr:hypothetical protein [Ectobacillus panaciterrae]